MTEEQFLELKRDYTQQSEILKQAAKERYPKLEKYLSNVSIEALAQLMREW